MFAKVFAQILDSSLAENYQVRLVFEDLLKLADKDGMVDMTKESIARRTNVPLEIVRTGIDALEMPDPTSRTPDHSGRRIIRLDAHRDWGWRIVNFQKYRECASKEMLRMAEKERKAAYRQFKGFPTIPLSPQTDSEGEADTDAEAEQSRTKDKVSRTSPGQNVELPLKVKEQNPKKDRPEQAHLEGLLRKWFKRREETTFSEKELKGIVSVLCLKTPPEDLAALDEYYTSDCRFKRRDLQTLLNNWNGEIDRAKDFKRNPSLSIQQTNGAPPHHIPIWKQIESLTLLITNSPANPQSARYNDRCSAEEKEKLKTWRTTLRGLHEQQARGNKQ